MLVFTVCQFVELALSLLVMALLIHNSYKILYLQKKVYVIPLTTYYILALLIVILRIYDAIWNFAADQHQEVMPFLMPQTLEFFVGINLCWVIVELSLRIRFSLKIDETDLRATIAASPESFIRKGRVVEATTIGLSVLIIAIVLIILDIAMDKDTRKEIDRDGLLYYVFTLQVIIFVALTTSILILFRLLKR